MFNKIYNTLFKLNNSSLIDFNIKLDSLSSKLDISRSKENFFEIISIFLNDNFSFDKITLLLINSNDTDEAEAVIVNGYNDDFSKGEKFNRSNTPVWNLMDEENSKIINFEKTLDKTNNFIDRYVKSDNLNHQFLSFLGVPLKTDDKVCGCLILESFTSLRFKNIENKKLKLFSDRLGNIINWWQKYDTLRHTSMHDGLTDLLNHKSFVERFKQEVRRAERYNETIVLIILDLDKFKRINDSYGHLFGDYVLKQSAKILKNGFRTIDLVARYGGEEFAVVLLNTSKQKSFDSIKRIIQNLSIYNFKKDNIKEKMTISAGLAEFPTNGKTISELISFADKAMYKVKKNGGNNVSID
tara:strand:- start:298 stop:1362 length:1065 start_codon:yes stop_codon:yes gene_type:complete